MNPITLIVTVSAAGTAAALRDGTSATVEGANAHLRAAVPKRLAGRLDWELMLGHLEAAPQAWQTRLVAELSETSPQVDTGLTAAAEPLMELLQSAAVKAGKFAVVVSGSQGVQVGDHSTHADKSASSQASPRA